MGKRVYNFLAIVLSLLIAVAIIPASTFTVGASTNGKSIIDAINWCESNLGKALDWDNSYGAQCVDFIRYYYDYLGKFSTGNAKEYRYNNCPSEWTRIYVTSSTALRAGDIAVWNTNISGITGENGHVGVVAADVASTSSTITVYNQNSNGRMYVTKDSEINKTYLHSVIRPDFVFHTHTWNSGVVTTKPTCKTDGIKTYTCTVCGETKAEAIAKGSHNYKAVSVTKKATLAKNGILKTKCSVCGKVSTSVIYYPKTIKLSKTSFTYNGKEQRPSVTVKNAKGNTVSKSYYTISYKNNKKVGKATVSVKFKGRYSGAKTLNFKIVPKGTAIKKLTSATKAFTVQWNKQATQTSGYQIQYAKNKNFKSAKSVIIANKNSTAKKVTGLAGYKKYYVRIRTYKRVAGVNYCSGWSAVKAITTNQTPTKLTNAKAKELYKTAEKEAADWLFTDSGCYYISDNCWNDKNTIFDDSGNIVAFPVYHKSITSVSKLKKHLSNYFDKSVYDTIVSNAYRDINGRLYFVVPYGIGGPCGYELKSVSLVSQKNNTAKIKIKIDEIYPDESRQTYTKYLNLKFVGNKWVFTNTFYVVYIVAAIKWAR